MLQLSLLPSEPYEKSGEAILFPAELSLNFIILAFTPK
jgi:hypothetical protein